MMVILQLNSYRVGVVQVKPGQNGRFSHLLLSVASIKGDQFILQSWQQSVSN